MKIARKYIPPISLLLVSTLGVAYAATNLFTQTFPAISAVSGITSNCTTLTPNLASVAAGSSGFAAFDCSGASPFGTTAALSVNAPGGSTTSAGGATIPITPSFTLPTVYTELALISDTSCGSGAGTHLAPGTASNLGTGSYRYCAAFQNAPSSGLPTFSITWTTPTTPFTQTFPAISGAAGITSNCATLTPFDPSSGAHMTSVAIGSTGFVYFDCSGASQFQTTWAFGVTVPGGSVTFTPQFTLPAPYTQVAITSGRCGGFVFSQISAGTPFTFFGSATYSYCVQFQNAPSTGLPTFSVTWTT